MKDFEIVCRLSIFVPEITLGEFLTLFRYPMKWQVREFYEQKLSERFSIDTCQLP